MPECKNPEGIADRFQPKHGLKLRTPEQISSLISALNPQFGSNRHGAWPSAQTRDPGFPRPLRLARDRPEYDLGARHDRVSVAAGAAAVAASATCEVHGGR